MDAATSTLHPSFGLGPRGPDPSPQRGPGPHAQAPGPRAPVPGPGPIPTAPRPEEQQHHKPFFYVQPPQPLPQPLPQQFMSMQGGGLQWPMPLPLPLTYNPYYTYPGLGYGMSMLPGYHHQHHQAAPYLEAPAFVLPQAHLHLTDYRRLLGPQYYHTMAYHARRFRYQHATGPAPSGPAPSGPAPKSMTSSQVQTEPLTQRTSTPAAGDAAAAAHQLMSPPSTVQKHDVTEAPPPSQTRTPPQNGGSSGGSFLIQTEEVRIECCSSPAAALQLLHEAAEVSRSFSPDVDQSEQALQVCPDILLIGGGGGEELCALTEARKQLGAEPPQDGDDLHLKVVHLPFDPQYLEELRRNEASVWSMDETCVPCLEPRSQNGRPDAESASQVVPSPRDSAHAEDTVVDSMFETTTMVPVAPEEEEVMSDLCPNMDAVAPEPLQMASSPQPGGGGGGGDDAQDRQDTSFESLPAYLPSSSWLADFDAAHYCRRAPPTPRKQKVASGGGGGGLDIPSRRRKLELEFKEPRFKGRGKAEPRSLSDHECCLRRSFAATEKRERLCSRCSAKTRGAACAPPPPPPSPGGGGAGGGRSLKRKSRPLQQWNDATAPTCDACHQLHARKLMRKGSNPDVRVLHRRPETEGESSENGSYHHRRRGTKWRPADFFKRPLAPKQNAGGAYTARPEQQGVVACDDPPPQHHQPDWERLRHCRHGNGRQEMDENCALPAALQERWRNQVYLTHRWHNERSWKTAMPHLDVDANDGGSQHFIKHKTTQSQGTRKKDARC